VEVNAGLEDASDSVKSRPAGQQPDDLEQVGRSEEPNELCKAVGR